MHGSVVCTLTFPHTARALVHARAVTSLFKASNVTLTVQSAHQVEISAIRAKLGLDRLPLYEKAPRAANGLLPNRASHSSAAVAETPTPRAQSPASFTSTRTSRLPQYTASSLARKDNDGPPTPSKTPMTLRRISAQEKRDAPLPPPPPPAEDSDDYEIVNAPIVTANAIAARLRGVSMADSMYSDVQSQYSQQSTDTAYRSSRIRGLSQTSYTYREDSSELGYLSSDSQSSKLLFLTEAQEHAALSRARWDEERDEINRPYRRGRTKSDIQREREHEEIEMARAAAEAAARKKYEKEQQALEEAEEEERKKVHPRTFLQAGAHNHGRLHSKKRNVEEQLIDCDASNFAGKRKSENALLLKRVEWRHKSVESKRHAGQRNVVWRRSAARMIGRDERKNESVLQNRNVLPG